MFIYLEEGIYQYDGYTLCNASDVIECDRRRSELSSALLHMTQNVNSIYKDPQLFDLPVRKTVCVASCRAATRSSAPLSPAACA